MVTHCNLARLHYLDGSVGGLCRNHGHVESYFCVGTTIVGDFWWRNEGKEAPWRLAFDSAPSALF